MPADAEEIASAVENEVTSLSYHGNWQAGKRRPPTNVHKEKYILLCTE